MQIVADILAEVHTRVADALGLDPSRVLDEPSAADMPNDEEPFAALRITLDQGRPSTVGMDLALLVIEVAAYVGDPEPEDNETVGAARIRLSGAIRDRLTPWSGGAYPRITGWDTVVMTQCYMGPSEDVPGQIFIGMAFQGDVGLIRGGA